MSEEHRPVLSDGELGDELLRPIPLRRELSVFAILNNALLSNEIMNPFIPQIPLNLGRLLEEELPFHSRQVNLRTHETELSRISSDVENVHDSKVNKNIKKLANEILKFPPGPDLDVMKTIFNEIIMTDEVRGQLTYMYYMKDKFLDYGESSYRKFMDCIISYGLSQSEDKKKEIFTILNNEINDSIGLCFQGNISRLINVLTGIIEIEIEYEPTIQEVFVEISKILDVNIKFEKAIKAFDDFNVAYSEWNSWFEALGLD
jgi:hypothetical protein